MYVFNNTDGSTGSGYSSKGNQLKFGIDNKWYKVIPITQIDKKSLKSNESVETIIQQFVYYNCLKNERLSA